MSDSPSDDGIAMGFSYNAVWGYHMLDDENEHVRGYRMLDDENEHVWGYHMLDDEHVNERRKS